MTRHYCDQCGAEVPVTLPGPDTIQPVTIRSTCGAITQAREFCTYTCLAAWAQAQGAGR